MTKEELRALVARQVKNLSPVYCREADEGICRGVLYSQPYRDAKTVFCYIGTDREIDTMPIIRAALQDGKNIAVPLCTEKGVMEARQIKGIGDLVSGKFGILAPRATCPLLRPEDLDVAIVPCCTGNSRGQRLGYGGGYYDRYLPQTHCPTMLLCRSRLVHEEIPTEDYDLAMAYFVTEQGVQKCQ